MSEPMAYGDIHRRLHEAIGEALDDEDVRAIDLMCAVTCVAGQLIAHDVPENGRATAARLFSDLIAHVIVEPDCDCGEVIRAVVMAMRSFKVK